LSTAPPFPYRWTVAEYVLRCTLDGTIRELFVEDEVDALFWGEVLQRGSVEAVEVFDADYVELSDDEIRAAGFMRGAKGRLLTLARALASDADHDPVVAAVVMLVDRDHDGVPAGLESVVIATDGYSVENYAIAERTTERFLARQFGRIASPVGASRTRRSRRNVPAGRALLHRLIAPAVDVTAVRRVLLARHPQVGVIQGWLRRYKINGDGQISGDAGKLLRDSIISGGEKFEDDDGTALEAERAYLNTDPPLQIRGHDFVALFLALLKSPWGKRAIGMNLANTEERDFGRWLVLSIDPGDVDHLPAARRLIERFR
jgi:Protein of unknown function (DUF4435)